MRYVPWLVRAVALAALLTLTPFAYHGGLQPNSACSAEHPGCLPEFDSICTTGGDPVVNFYNRASR